MWSDPGDELNKTIGQHVLCLVLSPSSSCTRPYGHPESSNLRSHRHTIPRLVLRLPLTFPILTTLGDDLPEVALQVFP